MRWRPSQRRVPVQLRRYVRYLSGTGQHSSDGHGGLGPVLSRGTGEQLNFTRAGEQSSHSLINHSGTLGQMLIEDQYNWARIGVLLPPWRMIP
jgi:hypothetical protein